MPSVGFQGALGADALSQAIRQQLMDKLTVKTHEHAMSVEDQRLALEKQRLEQDAADRAMLRTQQGATFNENVAEKTASNLTPQSIISPQLAERFKNTSLAPLISEDQTLPSTSLAGASSLVGAETPRVEPNVTQNASQLTGQLRYAGTPKQVQDASTKVLRGQMLSEPSLTPQQRLEMQAESVGLKAPTREPKPTVDPTQTHATNRLFDLAHPMPQNPQLAIIQTQNDQGQNVTKIVPKVAGAEFAGKQDAQTVASERASKEALGTFDQLDQAIDAAKDLIGPGEGRVSTVQQMIGNPDPRINELGVMIKASKMRADHAITGSVRAAASPTLIKQWDELLANKLTPEALHGTVKALRAVVQGPGGGAADGSGKRVVYDMNGKVVSQ